MSLIKSFPPATDRVRSISTPADSFADHEAAATERLTDHDRRLALVFLPDDPTTADPAVAHSHLALEWAYRFADHTQSHKISRTGSSSDDIHDSMSMEQYRAVFPAEYDTAAEELILRSLLYGIRRQVRSSWLADYSEISAASLTELQSTLTAQSESVPGEIVLFGPQDSLAPLTDDIANLASAFNSTVYAPTLANDDARERCLALQSQLDQYPRLHDLGTTDILRVIKPEFIRARDFSADEPHYALTLVATDGNHCFTIDYTPSGSYTVHKRDDPLNPNWQYNTFFQNYVDRLPTGGFPVDIERPLRELTGEETASQSTLNGTEQNGHLCFGSWAKGRGTRVKDYHATLANSLEGICDGVVTVADTGYYVSDDTESASQQTEHTQTAKPVRDQTRSDPQRSLTDY